MSNPVSRSLGSPQRGRWRWRSTSGRFLLLHLVLSLACTLPILLFVFFQVDRILVADFARPLEFRQSNLEKQFDIGGVEQLTAAVESRAQRAHRDQTAILLTDPQGRKVAGNLTAWPRGISAPQYWTPSLLVREGGIQAEEFLVRTMRLPSGHRLLLGGLLDGRADMHRALLLALLAAFVLAVPFGLLGSVAIVREMNRMVAAIADVGQQVGAGDLGRRAAIDGSSDPVDRLKLSLNTLLDRIEALVEEHRVLTDALAHDLRSPLTRMHIELTAARTPPHDHDPAARFQAIAQEVEYVLHILDGALEISRAEAGIGRGNFNRLDIAEMLYDLCEIYQPLAATNDVRITVACATGQALYGNRALVARAVANLIDNALKYGAEGGEVTLDASVSGDVVHLCVSDRAGGIPPERQSEALRKFGRLDAARGTPGSGLGLTLARAVASLHGGTLALEDNGPGLRVRLVLPLRPPSITFRQGDIV